MRLRLNGQTYQSTFDSEKDAQVWATSIKAQYKANQLSDQKPYEKRSLRSLVNSYIEQNVMAESTKKTYRTMTKHFSSVMDKPFGSVSNWQRIVSMECKKYNPNSVALWWKEVGAVLRFHGIDVPKVKITKKPSQQKEYLNNDEIKVFCNAIKGSPNEAYYLMMLHSLRVSEAINLKDEDITEDGMYVHGTKTEASDRFVPWMIPRLKEIIMDRPPCYKEKLNRELKDICQANGLPAISCHSLRISYCSLLYTKSVPERICMKIGGWSSLSVMHQVYVRIGDDDVKRYADAVSEIFIDNSVDEINPNIPIIPTD